MMALEQTTPVSRQPSTRTRRVTLGEQPKGMNEGMLKVPDGHGSFTDTLKRFWKERLFRKSPEPPISGEDRKSKSAMGYFSPEDGDRSEKGNETPTRAKRTLSSVNEENMLHFMVTREDIAALNRILDSGRVDVNFMRPPGVAPLHQACAIGNANCVKLLLERGADANLLTWQGLSPLKIAASHGHFDIAEILLEAGADPNDIRDGLQS